MPPKPNSLQKPPPGAPSPSPTKVLARPNKTTPGIPLTRQQFLEKYGHEPVNPQTGRPLTPVAVAVGSDSPIGSADLVEHWPLIAVGLAAAAAGAFFFLRKKR
jgi:LPXTG-motif cell wall-anchored protein